MQVTKPQIFIAGVLIAVSGLAADSATVKTAQSSKPAGIAKIREGKTVDGDAAQERKMEIFEHAAANRELAALTQMDHARTLEEQASELMNGPGEVKTIEYKKTYKKAGLLEKEAAVLYGQAAANFDKAAVNRKMVASISKSIGKVEQYRNAESYAANMTLQGNEAMRMAADACEAAAVAFDKAGEPTEVAANSQLAATWLEKLAVR